MNKQSPERLEYLRNYRKNHKEQQRKYQKKYIDKLRQQGKYPISTSMKLRNEIETLIQELQRKDNNWNELKNELEQEIATVSTNRVVDYNNPEWWYKLNCYGNILDKIKKLESGK